MSSPIAHAAVSYAVYSIFRRKLPGEPVLGIPPRIAWPLAVLFFSLLADLDAIAGWSLGSLEKYHNNFFHSLLVCIAAALVLAVPLRIIAKAPFKTGFLLILTCCVFHVLIDLCTMGRGVMLLWPFTELRFHSPVTLFIGVPWSFGLSDPLYLLMLLNDSCFAAAVIAVVFAVRRRSLKPG